MIYLIGCVLCVSGITFLMRTWLNLYKYLATHDTMTILLIKVAISSVLIWSGMYLIGHKLGY
jgi:hypothetical protein